MRPGFGSLTHQRIAMLLGDDRGGGDAAFQPVPAHHGAGRPAPFRAAACGRKIAVHQHFRRIAAMPFAHRLDRAGHGEHGRLKDVERVDFLHAGDADAPMAALLNARSELCAPGCAQHLAVGEAADFLAAQDDGGGHHRAGERSAPGLVHACYGSGDDQRPSTFTACCPIGPLSATKSGAARRLARTKARARAIASGSAMPSPSPAAMALASVQPVP